MSADAQERRGPVLSTAAAAAYCGFSNRQTMYNLAATGEGPRAFKQGRLTVYYPVDLDAWLTSRLVEIVKPEPDQ